MAILDIKSGPESIEKNSFTRIATISLEYMLKNVLPNTVGKSLRSSIVDRPGIVIKSLATLGKLGHFDTRNLGISSNEVIARQEGLKGFTPHNQTFELNPLFRVAELDTKKPNLKKTAISNNKEMSRHTAVEPFFERIVESLVFKYNGQPSKTLDFNESSGKLSVTESREKKLGLDNAIRLVLPTSDGKKIEFVNITYDQYLEITDKKAPTQRMRVGIATPTLISDILNNGLSEDQRKYFSKLGISTYPLDSWYDQEAAIVTISSQDFFVYDQRGAMQVNVSLSLDPKTDKYQPTKVDTQAVHMAATAVPITEWFVNEILPIGEIIDQNPVSTNKKDQIDSDTVRVINQFVDSQRFSANSTLPEYSPKLAKYQAALILAGYPDEGSSSLSQVTNLREVIIRQKLPDGLLELTKQNNSILKLLKEIDPDGFKDHKGILFTTYFMLAVAMLDQRSSMLSVNPDKTGRSPNALELALLCNGANPTTERIIESINRLLKSSSFDMSNIDPSMIIDDKSVSDFNKMMTINTEYSSELERAGNGMGTPGILARLAGSMRNALEGFSRQLAAPAMAQLEPSTQISSLGSMLKSFKNKVSSWFFNSSHSKSVTEWQALNDDNFTVGERAFANPLTLILTLDEHCDPVLFDGLIRTYSNKTDVDKYDRILLDWMIGRRNQEIITRDVDAQHNSYNSILGKMYKDIITRRLEKSKSRLSVEFNLAKKLQQLHAYPPYSDDFKNLPKKDRDTLNSLFNQLALDADQPTETIIDAWSERINSLPNGVHDLFTKNDPVWTKYLESIKNIDVLEPGNSLAPSIREHIEKSASELSLDVNTSQLVYSKDLVFTNLGSFYEHAGSDAELMEATREMADRFSLVLAKYITANPNNSEQKANLIQAINLNTAKKAVNTLNTASSVALALNIHLTTQLVARLYMSGSPNIKQARQREVLNEEGLVSLFMANDIPVLDLANKQSIIQLFEKCAKYEISPRAIVNFIVKQNPSWQRLASTVIMNSSPQETKELTERIKESIQRLNINPHN